jgi:hypothetical protein
MNAPTTMAEYTKRFMENERVEGDGPSTTVVMSCPFCAAPDFMRLRILEGEAAMAMAAGATCQQCGRSARTLFDRRGGEMRAELVQTGGDEQPEWLASKMRRVES